MQDQPNDKLFDIYEESAFLTELFSKNAAKIKEEEMFESALSLGHPIIAQTISDILAGKYDTENPQKRGELILLYKNILVFLLLKPEDQENIRGRILGLAERTGADAIPGVHDITGMLSVIDGSDYIQRNNIAEETEEEAA